MISAENSPLIGILDMGRPPMGPKKGIPMETPSKKKRKKKKKREEKREKETKLSDRKKWRLELSRSIIILVTKETT